MKLQHHDFSGRYDRSSWHRRTPAKRRRLLVRYGALALLAFTLVGLKRFAATPSDGNHPRAVGVAAAGLAGAQPEPGSASRKGGTSDAAAAAVPGSAGLDFQSPFQRYPEPDTFAAGGRTLVAEYAADSLLHARVGLYLERYRPDAGVVLVSDLKSGRILGVGERVDSLVRQSPRMAFQNGFPAASLVKILTATAALQIDGKGPEDSIPQLGSYHTLYRRQLKVGSAANAPKVTLQEAFSRSVNPAFGVLGLSMGGQALETTARSLGFNRAFQCVRPSHFQAQDTGFALAETSCGFTPRTTISPMHALAIARGIGDDGTLRFGAFARSLVDVTDRSAPKALDVRNGPGTVFLTPANLPKLQAMMEATVRSGTARKGFHQVMRAVHLEKLTVGGKTGSLDGLAPRSEEADAVETGSGAAENGTAAAGSAADPAATAGAVKGRFDWFIGYARLKDDPSRGLAFSIMLVHGQYANVRSTVLAALLIRDWLAAEEKSRKQARPSATATRAGGLGAAAVPDKVAQASGAGEG